MEDSVSEMREWRKEMDRLEGWSPEQLAARNAVMRKLAELENAVEHLLTAVSPRKPL